MALTYTARHSPSKDDTNPVSPKQSADSFAVYISLELKVYGALAIGRTKSIESSVDNLNLDDSHWQVRR